MSEVIAEKTISLDNKVVGPLGVNTGQGTILLGQPLVKQRVANLIYSGENNRWIDIKGNLTQIVNTQQTGPLLGEVSPFLELPCPVAISYDGSTAVVGQPGSNAISIAFTGGVWVFSYEASSDSWIQQGDMIVGSGAIGYAGQGSSVSLSGDGNVLAVSGPYDNPSLNVNQQLIAIGAVWIFTRSGTTWTQQTKLVEPNGPGTAGLNFGTSISLSSSGTTLAVGASSYNGGQGAIYIYAFNSINNTWTLQVGPLIGSGTSPNNILGFSISISLDGLTIAAGAFAYGSLLGGVWVWKYISGVWTGTEGGNPVSFRITSGLTGNLFLGYSVSLNDNGTTIAIGGPLDSPHGGVWLYNYNSVTARWVASQVLTPNNGIGSSQFGSSVSIYGDTLVIGGPGDDNGIGAVWIFTYSPTLEVWSQQSKVIINGGNSYEEGSFVSLSSNNIFISGGMDATQSIGQAWIYNYDSEESVWELQAGPLGNELYEVDQQGSSVAISADGNTVLIGQPLDPSSTSTMPYVGIVTVFTRVLPNTGWINQGTLQPSIPVAYSFVGDYGCVALSSDGNTAVIGGRGYTNVEAGDGIVYVWNRVDGSWNQITSFVPNDYGSTGAAGFGTVALSSDGNTLAVGGQNNNTNVGGVWIFVNTGSNNWEQQGNILSGSDAVGESLQGYSLSLSADGNTLAVGGPGDQTSEDNIIGATWIYVRDSFSGGNWTQQGLKLISIIPPDTISAQGTSVDLSSDGNILAVGDPLYNSNRGCVSIYIRDTFNSVNTWSLSSILVGSGGSEDNIAGQGTSVSLSSNGNTLVVGGPLDNSGTGAVWIFTRNPSLNSLNSLSSSQWTQYGSKLVANNLTSPSSFGFATAIDSNADTLIIGAPFDNSQTGGCWIYG